MATGYMLPFQTTLQWFTDQGVVGSGYQIYTYLAGTTTPVTTYTSNTLTTANSNPIVLQSNGRLPASAWVPAGTVIKMVLTDATGGIISGGTIDNMAAINDLGIISGTGTLSLIGASFTGGYTSVGVRYYKIGMLVSVRLGGWTGQATATSITLQGLPSTILPTVEQSFLIRTNDNGVYQPALAVIYPYSVNSAGAIQIYPDVPGNLWTLGNLCGQPSDCTMVYSLIP